MNRHDRAVAAGWAEAHAKEAEARQDAISQRERSIRVGGAWAPRVSDDWREPVYKPRADIPIAMVEDIRRGQRRGKKFPVPLALERAAR